MQSAGPAAHRQPCLGDPPMQQIQLYMTHQLQGQLLGTPHLSSQVQELHRRLQARLSGMPAAMRVQSLMLWGGSVHKKWTGCSVFCSRGNPSRRCSWRHTAAYRSAPAAVHCMLPRIPLLQFRSCCVHLKRKLRAFNALNFFLNARGSVCV